MIIDIRDWEITYKELTKWCAHTGAIVYGRSHTGRQVGILSTSYEFKKESDYLAFCIKFKKK